MNKLLVFTLRSLRKIYTTVFGTTLSKPECELDPNKASQIIYDTLMSDKPCMIARFGSNELLCLVTYFGVKENNKNIISYITGKSFGWWWNEENLKNMHLVAGFFPPLVSKFEQFCELMLQDLTEVDVLGSWLVNEQLIKQELKNAQKVDLRLLEPYWAENHWSRALEGKKVLVVHPFAKDIERQYQKRELLFKNNILPQFQLTTIKAVLSLADEKTAFADWFEALDNMKAEIDKVDYDICLIGCGAYGFHLAAHVKRSGKKGFHYGGALQLLFGIRGSRWEDPNYGVQAWGIPVGFYVNLMNEHWISPSKNQMPKNAQVVEGACYW
jgi:hypothetical protein